MPYCCFPLRSVISHATQTLVIFPASAFHLMSFRAEWMQDPPLDFCTEMSKPIMFSLLSILKVVNSLRIKNGEILLLKSCIGDVRPRDLFKSTVTVFLKGTILSHIIKSYFVPKWDVHRERKHSSAPSFPQISPNFPESHTFKWIIEQPQNIQWFQWSQFNSVHH